jgi:hypothetical protein
MSNEKFSCAVKTETFVGPSLDIPLDVIFKANTSLKECNDFSLRNNCDFKIEIPQIEEVYY